MQDHTSDSGSPDNFISLSRLVRQSQLGTVRITIGVTGMSQVTYYTANGRQDIRGTPEEITDHINSWPDKQETRKSSFVAAFPPKSSELTSP